MKKKILLILMLLLSAITVSVIAQPMASMRVPYRQVIISEYRPHNEGYWVLQDCYVELTNVGDSTVNLSDFYYCTFYQASMSASSIFWDEEGNLVNVYYKSGTGSVVDANWARLPDFLLKPGESFVISAVYDGTNADGSLKQREQMVEASDMYVHCIEIAEDSTIYKTYYPEFQNFDFDSVSVHYFVLHQSGQNTALLHHRIYDTAGVVVDSVCIDGIKFGFTATGGGDLTNTRPNIAGVSEATREHILVRKSDIKHGNLNWDLQAGVSAEDSEWILLPKFTGRNIWTTVGVHGNFHVIAESDILDIYAVQQVIKVPWGVYKINNGDSIMPLMTLGPGMAWEYVENAENFEGGSHTICQEGDTLIFYATGNELETKEFRLIQNPPEANENRVFPLRVLGTAYIWENDVIVDTVPAWLGTPFYVTNYGTIMDTVGSITFATRVDTLFKYLEKPEKASWEIIWVDGQPRVDLKHGDILRVTAENGVDTRDYYLDVLPYEPSSNAFLSSITWPDKPGFLMDWKQDTIPGFAKLTTLYNVPLPYQYADVPALQVTKQDQNAKVQMFPAVSLDGTIEERTTRIQVTAEDESTVIDYYVTFSKGRPSSVIQPWAAEPFFSEFIYSAPGGGSDAWLEIYNPGTEPIDMSNYMLSIAPKTDPVAVITGIIPWINANYIQRYIRNSGYIPGYKWPATKEEWDLNPGKVIFDPVVDPILEPGEVFLLGSAWSTVTAANVSLIEKADVIFSVNANSWGETNLNTGVTMLQYPMPANQSAYLFKILNDSIQQGLKAIKDPADFELIEYMGYSTTTTWEIAGRVLSGSPPWTIIRKPYINTPSTEVRRGWGTNTEDSDWIVVKHLDTYQGITYTYPMLIFDLDRHTCDPVTFYRSTVTSRVYKVTDGYQGNLTIRGVSHSENVEAFFNNLIKADTGQVLVVSATVGGPAKELTEAVAENDILTVTSADDENQTTYTISLTPLDNNNTLTLADGSNLVIAREGNAGTISGFNFGTTISAVFEQVVKPASASLRIINEKGELLPMKVMNTDTVKVSTVVDNDVYFKVTAENGDTALYHLQPSSLASDAYVLSDLYVVNQEASTISNVIGGTGVSNFYANLKPAAGASMQVRDKKGMARNMGNISFDDFLYVISEDQSVTKIYFIQFIKEPEGLQTGFRTLCPDISNLTLANVSPDGTEATLEWDYDFGLEFGFVILRDSVVKDTVIANTFTDHGLVQGVVYQYSVYAYNEFGNSRTRSVWVGRTLCPDPSNLTLANLSPDGTQATLAWDYDFGLEYGFVIVRDGSVIDTVLTNTFTDQGLVPGGTYEYSVYAYNEFGNSGSKTITVTTTAIDQIDAEGIIIYPNITTGMIYFRNLPEGSRVVLTDLAGRTILIKNAYDLSDGLSLQPYENGYYLIRVIQGQEYLKSVKVLKM